MEACSWSVRAICEIAQVSELDKREIGGTYAGRQVWLQLVGTRCYERIVKVWLRAVFALELDP